MLLDGAPLLHCKYGSESTKFLELNLRKRRGWHPISVAWLSQPNCNHELSGIVHSVNPNTTGKLCLAPCKLVFTFFSVHCEEAFSIKNNFMHYYSDYLHVLYQQLVAISGWGVSGSGHSPIEDMLSFDWYNCLQVGEL